MRQHFSIGFAFLFLGILGGLGPNGVSHLRAAELTWERAPINREAQRTTQETVTIADRGRPHFGSSDFDLPLRFFTIHNR